MGSSSLSHKKWKCQCHVVFIPKYRRKVLYGKIKLDVRQILKKLCAYKGVEMSTRGRFGTCEKVEKSRGNGTVRKGPVTAR